jgi:hypothetical protein
MDEERLYLENLDEYVNDEAKIVTYKWLSRTLSVNVDQAKRLTVVHKHCNCLEQSESTHTRSIGKVHVN